MIERRTPLHRDTPGTRAWLRKPRKPLPKVGAKARRERSAVDAFTAALQARSHGRCEASSLVDLTGQRVCGRVGPHSGTDPHHVWPEDRGRAMHVPSRGLWLCRTAHDWAHNVAPAAESGALGLLRPVECLIRIDRAPTDSQAIDAATFAYGERPETRSLRIEWPLGRLVVPPPGIAVEWRT